MFCYGGLWTAPWVVVFSCGACLLGACWSEDRGRDALDGALC
jgi:hypothetical protein